MAADSGATGLGPYLTEYLCDSPSHSPSHSSSALHRSPVASFEQAFEHEVPAGTSSSSKAKPATAPKEDSNVTVDMSECDSVVTDMIEGKMKNTVIPETEPKLDDSEEVLNRPMKKVNRILFPEASASKTSRLSLESVATPIKSEQPLPSSDGIEVDCPAPELTESDNKRPVPTVEFDLDLKEFFDFDAYYAGDASAAQPTEKLPATEEEMDMDTEFHDMDWLNELIPDLWTPDTNILWHEFDQQVHQHHMEVENQPFSSFPMPPHAVFTQDFDPAQRPILGTVLPYLSRPPLSPRFLSTANSFRENCNNQLRAQHFGVDITEHDTRGIGMKATIGDAWGERNPYGPDRILDDADFQEFCRMAKFLPREGEESPDVEKMNKKGKQGASEVLRYARGLRPLTKDDGQQSKEG